MVAVHKNQYRIPFAAVVKTRERWERRGGGEVLRRVWEAGGGRD